MKCISDIYNIYLTEDKTLLFYNTLRNGELNKPVIEVKDISGNSELLELVETLAKYPQDEILERYESYLNIGGTVSKCVSEIIKFMSNVKVDERNKSTLVYVRRKEKQSNLTGKDARFYEKIEKGKSLGIGK